MWSNSGEAFKQIVASFINDLLESVTLLETVNCFSVVTIFVAVKLLNR